MKQIFFWFLFVGCYLNPKCQSASNYITVLTHKTKAGLLTGYYSSKQIIYYVTQRPVIDKNTQLMVPAGFTSRIDNKIDGLSVCFGTIKQSKFNDSLTGYCLIENAKPKIIYKNELTEKYKAHIIESKSSLFEQDILIKNSSIIKFPLFEKGSDYWRALAIFKDHFEIIETVNKAKISEFQQALKEIGVIDAIYLDMGTWSEGSYLNSNNIKVKIGHNTSRTRFQTSWLVL